MTAHDLRVHDGQVFRLLELLAGLAGVTDLGTGAPPDESLRRCVVAARLARALEGPDQVVRDAVWVALLEHVGCTAYAHETGRTWGDDVAATRTFLRSDPGSPSDVLAVTIPGLAAASGRSRAGVAVRLARTLRTDSAAAPVATCEVAEAAATRLGLGPVARASFGHLTAMWDGRGHPRVSGEEIPLPARVMQVAAVAVMCWGLGGPEAAVAEVRRRAGRELDPTLAGLLVDGAGELLGDLGAADPFRLALDAEPDPVDRVDADRLLAVAEVCGDLVDLKSPWLHGHSGAVGRLSGAAADLLGLPEAGDVRVAGHLHDVGRVGVPSRIWDAARPWSGFEADQARLHPYYTARVLARVPALAGLAEVAGAHHERCDGSGYHRGLRGERLSTGARVLAAADAYRTLVEARPHRPGLSSAAAVRRLATDARAGLLDPDAVSAVEAAVTGGTARRPRGAAGLTPRQVEVLRLLTRGLPAREVAAQLGLSRRTVERHVADVYGRIGVSSRAAAALFAIEHGLVGAEGPDGPDETDEPG